MSSRTTLKGFFSTGLRPTQAQFHDLIDSAASLAESNNGTLTVTGGVVVGNVNVPTVPGAIRWTGVNFEFHNGAGFQPLSFGGAVITNPLDVGNVRIGSTLTGGMAAMAHASRYSASDFAFGQTAAGATLVSSGTSIQFQDRSAGTTTNVLTIASKVATVNTSLFVNSNLNVNTQLIVGTPPGGAPAIPVGTLLAVYGEARKLTGGAWTVMSDVRVKENISDFSEGLEKLIQIKPVRFKYKNLKDNFFADTEQVGVLAHEVKPVFPYMVGEVKAKIAYEDEEESDLLTFNSSALQFVMINAIKELNNRLQNIEQSISKNNQ